MGILGYFRPFGVDFFCLGKKFLVFNLVSRNLKVKYRRSVLGVLWTVLSPLAMTAVYYFVFKIILKVTIPHYLVFIVSGILPWSFFSQSTIEGMESIVGNLGLVTKVPIPLQLFPFVGTLTNLTTLTIATPILIAAAVVSDVPLGLHLLMLGFYFPVLFFVFLRDLRHITGIVMQIWFYATPVVYQDSMIPEKLRWTIYANPVAPVFIGLHQVLAGGAWPGGTLVIASVGWTVALTLTASFVYKRYNRILVESL
jgi:ABC-type polysaccharide/polyol phosphate export permease